MSQKRIKVKTAGEYAKESRLKLESVQQEYWRLRNQKKEYMRCPYCKDTNYPGDDPLCCELFAKAFKAVLDRQEEVDKGLAMAGQVQRMLSGYVQ